MMQYGKIEGIDKPISRLVQGTVMFNGSDSEKEFALLDGIFELGCTTFDSGHIYGDDGDCEQAFGAWVNARKLRDKVVLIDKAAHHNNHRKRVTPFDISADLHDSLARLQFDYIDLYMLHRDDESVPVGPIIDILNDYLKQGLILSFGASNWSHKRIEEANAYAAENNLQGFSYSSPNFSLAEQIQAPWPGCVSISGEAGAEARDWYLKQNMPLFTWSSLAGGFFSGRFERDNLDSFTDYFAKLCVDCYCNEENFQKLDRVKELAERKGMSIPQIATAYVTNHPLDIFAIVGCGTVDEFRANVEAMQLTLTLEELGWLEHG